jgi:HEPN domain-containing protein
MESRRFLRVAMQHLGDAQLLFDHGSKTGAAMYLAGYAVECALKALLLAHAPARKQAQLVALFRGTKAHDFDWLRQQLRQRNVEVAAHIGQHLTTVKSWSVALRYDPSQRRPRETRAFLAAVNAILNWVRGCLS